MGEGASRLRVMMEVQDENSSVRIPGWIYVFDFAGCGDCGSSKARTENRG